MALKFIPRLAIHKKLALVQQFSLIDLFTQPPPQIKIGLSEKQYQALISPDWQKIDSIIERVKSLAGKVIPFDHADYPQKLKEIYDPPLVLFVKGDSKVLNHPQLAIVGSRNVSVHGRETAYQFAHELSEQEIVVTSGLALGVDAHAHKGAVDNKSATIAVIATGIDLCYPARHKNLVKKIIENGGAIVSEFLPNTPPKSGHFPKRNRIISGMSAGVLIIEAAMRSGSLITARFALEQNRDVFAVPGNINNPQIKGCHWLIKQGAKLVEELADIMEEVSFDSKNSLDLRLKQSRNKEKEKESKKSCDQDLFNDSLLASVGYEITPVDTVVSRSKLPTDVVLTRLTMLELRGLVSAVPGGYLKN
ncbi:DNA-processing protein DprA [Thalassotalea sp. SU-HH00458]|uniref:DNA-processing protein DprA n=1 Tax=Thalassotalea sp. SU-HH00458 TaxID=3127657 RepID=UPI0031024E6C